MSEETNVAEPVETTNEAVNAEEAKEEVAEQEETE